jgi:hypothetical protein
MPDRKQGREDYRVQFIAAGLSRLCATGGCTGVCTSEVRSDAQSGIACVEYNTNGTHNFYGCGTF